MVILYNIFMGRASRKNNSARSSSAGGNMRSQSPYSILSDVQDALYDVTTAKDKVEQIEMQIEQATSLRDDPSEGAKALDQIGLLIRDVNMAGKGSPEWERVSEALRGDSYMGSSEAGTSDAEEYEELEARREELLEIRGQRENEFNKLEEELEKVDQEIEALVEGPMEDAYQRWMDNEEQADEVLSAKYEELEARRKKLLDICKQRENEFNKLERALEKVDREIDELAERPKEGSFSDITPALDALRIRSPHN